MKCPNCGKELTGKFCTNCGTPAPKAEQEAQTEVNTQPEVQPAATEAPAENTAEPVVNEQQNEQFYAQPFNTGQPANNAQQSPNQTSFGQQFTNQKSEFAGQQFTNTDAQPQKKSGTGKTVAIVLSIVGGVVLILAIIVGVVACNFMNAVGKGISDAVNEYSGLYSDLSSDLSSYDSSDDYFDSEKLYDEKSRFYYEQSEDYDGLKITGYEMDYDLDEEGTHINIEVPEKIDGKNVVEIEEIHAYYDDAYVTVIIPGTVKRIDGYSMSFVDDYDEVIIKEGVEIIEEDAFLGGERFKKFTVPASVTQMEGCGIGLEVYNDDYSNPKPLPGFELYGKAGSAAEKYAKENNLKFIAQ